MSAKLRLNSSRELTITLPVALFDEDLDTEKLKAQEADGTAEMSETTIIVKPLRNSVKAEIFDACQKVRVAKVGNDTHTVVDFDNQLYLQKVLERAITGWDGVLMDDDSSLVSQESNKGQLLDLLPTSVRVYLVNKVVK